MSKRLWNICREHVVWLIVLILSDAIFAVLLWLENTGEFIRLFLVFLLGTAVLYSLILFFLYTSEQKKEKAFLSFLEDTDSLNEADMVRLFGRREGGQLHRIAGLLQENGEKINAAGKSIQEYEEYIENWAHEIKTPLALMTFLLDNRQEDIPEEVHNRLECIRIQMQEDIENILYYARLKAPQTDYLFGRMSLLECCEEILEEYGFLLRESGFTVLNEVEDIQVVSDRKGVRFLLSQILSNAVKYTKESDDNPHLHLYTLGGKVERNFQSCVLGPSPTWEKPKRERHGYKEGSEYVLGIRDSGIGVKPYDMPFLFKKGFTGDNGRERKKATGMGLYLAKQMADSLKIRIEVEEEYRDGFGIFLIFPRIERSQ